MNTDTEKARAIVVGMIINKKQHDALEYPNYQDESELRILGDYFDLDYDMIDHQEIEQLRGK